MPMAAASAFDSGDVLWIEFGAPFGQAGRRPAVVVSPQNYNAQSSVILVCPITRNPRDWPFKVKIPPVGKLTGSIMVDQIRAIDPKIRSYGPFGRVPEDVIMEVRRRLVALLGIPRSS